MILGKRGFSVRQGVRRDRIQRSGPPWRRTANWRRSSNSTSPIWHRRIFPDTNSCPDKVSPGSCLRRRGLLDGSRSRCWRGAYRLPRLSAHFLRVCAERNTSLPGKTSDRQERRKFAAVIRIAKASKCSPPVMLHRLRRRNKKEIVHQPARLIYLRCDPPGNLSP